MSFSYCCPACGLKSHHPDDLADRYCSHCRRFEGDAGEASPRVYALRDRTVHQLGPSDDRVDLHWSLVRMICISRRGGRSVAVITEFRPVPLEHSEEIPCLFSTKVILQSTGAEFDHLERFYRTYAEALEGHHAVVSAFLDSGAIHVGGDDCDDQSS